MPESFTGKHNSPTIHRVVDPKGKERLILFVSYPVMKQSVSEDEGRTWTPLAPVFSDDLEGSPGYKGHAPPKSVIPISDGRLLAMYHDHFRQGGRDLVEPMQIISEDGGLTWSNPRQVGSHSRYPDAHPCEPGLIRSPDGKRILCLLRENSFLTIFLRSSRFRRFAGTVLVIVPNDLQELHRLLRTRSDRIISPDCNDALR